MKLICVYGAVNSKIDDSFKNIGFHYKQEVEKNEGGYGQLFYKNI